MNKIWAIAGIVLLALLAAYFLWGEDSMEPASPPLVDRTGGDERATTSGPVVPDADYGTRLVYTADASADTKPLIADCKARGGTFNECGSPCPPDAEACVAMCVFSCEDIRR